MKPPNPLKFSEMYSKLRSRTVGKTFTTFRAYDHRKDKYYHSLKERVLPIELSGKDRRFLGRAKLYGIDYGWSCDMSLAFIKNDTYEHWDIVEWLDLMDNFYGQRRIFGIILELMWTEVVP